MNARDLAVRNLTYQLFVELGRAPTLAEAALAADANPDVIVACWRRLHDEHALVLHPGTVEIRMATPFSAVPTGYRVMAAGRWWYANCAWDAFGICAALDADGTLEASCPDCGEAFSIEVREQHPSDDTLLFHCLVPAASWWDDIGYT